VQGALGRKWSWLSFRRVGDASHEEDAAGAIVADEEDEGWSARNSGGGVGSGARIAVPTIITAVAAAASVPTSFTSINALWITAEINNSRLPVMPEKSAAFRSKALGIPIALAYCQAQAALSP